MIEIISIGIGIYLLYAGFIGVDNYEMLRIIVFIGGILLLFNLSQEKNINLGAKKFYLIFTTLLILIFNPIIPLYLYDRSLWALIDVISGGILVIIPLVINETRNKVLDETKNKVMDDYYKVSSKKKIIIPSVEDTKKGHTEIKFIPLINRHISENRLLSKLEMLMVKQSQNNNNTKRYDIYNHKDLIYYHLVCYLSSLLKIYLSIDDKKGLIKADSFISNLEVELIEFKNDLNIERYDAVKPVVIDDDTFIYERICSLKEVDLPYFSQVRYNDEDYNKVSVTFVINLAILLQPRNLRNAGVSYQQFVFNLNDIAINILNDSIIKNNT